MKCMRWSGVLAVLVTISGCSAAVPQNQDEGALAEGSTSTEESVPPEGETLSEGNETPPEDSEEGGITSEGDCVAIGHGNEQDCTIINLPARVESFGGLSVEWGMGGGQSVVYFDGPIEDVPKPPDYPMGEDPEWNPEDGIHPGPVNHCDLWEEWFQDTPEVYRIDPIVNVGLQGGLTESVAIKSVSAQVLDRPNPADEGVILTCAYGAGGDYGAVIDVDTETGITTLRENADTENEVSGPMPPGSFSLNDEEGSQSLSALINLNSPRYLYSGIMTIDGQVNSETPYIHIGTPSEPIRWVGDAGFEEYMGAAYGWNVETQEWVLNFTPGMLEDLDWY
jgi:hypothetical protein